eukprot:2916105-Amphidinium_carterae.1
MEPTRRLSNVVRVPSHPKQGRWQDTDNVSVNFGITYQPGYDPDKDADDFTMTHDLTATSTSRQDVSATDPSSGGTLADEGRTSSTAMPAMSSTGHYEATEEPSSGGTLADEGHLPDAELSDDSSIDSGKAPMDPTLPSMGKYNEKNYNSCFICCNCGARDRTARPLEDRCWYRGFGDASITFAGLVAKTLGSTSQQECTSGGVVVMIINLFRTKSKIGKGVFQILMQIALPSGAFTLVFCC